MKRAIVTGGMGFIGSHIVDSLIEKGLEVTVIDDMSATENEKFYKNKNAKNVVKDISKDNCEDLFKEVDCVFHLAARSRIQPTIGNPSECFEVNVVGTQRVAEWCRKNKVKKLIYSGTSSLYGHQNTVPFMTNMPTDCLNPYSMSKWMGEQVCKLYSQLYDLDSTVLRYFNVYGPREPIKGKYAPVVGLFKRQVRDGKPMTIVGDGTQRRDFTYIDDVVDANIKAMNSDKGGFRIYNIGTGVNHSILEVSGMIGKDRVFVEKRPAEVKETLADITLTSEELGWFPRFKLKEKVMSY